jgi:hypothetical protein
MYKILLNRPLSSQCSWRLKMWLKNTKPKMKKANKCCRLNNYRNRNFWSRWCHLVSISRIQLESSKRSRILKKLRFMSRWSSLKVKNRCFNWRVKGTKGRRCKMRRRFVSCWRWIRNWWINKSNSRNYKKKHNNTNSKTPNLNNHSKRATKRINSFIRSTLSWKSKLKNMNRSSSKQKSLVCRMCCCKEKLKVTSESLHQFN